MPVIRHERLQRIYVAVAAAHGASPAEAETFATCLVRADLRGYTLQGAALVPYYHELLRDGVLQFGRWPDVEAEGPGFAALDGHRNVGQVIGTRAIEIASEKASESGIALVTVANSGDFAMASGFALQALAHDQIGIAMGNGYPLVAPWGGRDPFFCTNPLAIAVPTGDEAPLVIDMATSSYSMGQTVRAARDGRRLEGIAVVDPQGRYGDDPGAIVVDPMDRESPLNGAILPAGHKGFGWLLIVEVLAGVLSGARGSYVNRVDSGPSPRTQYGNCFMAIDVGHFIGVARFKADMDELIGALRSAHPAEGFDAVRVPGERSAREHDRRIEHGVPVREEEWRIALDMCDELGIDLSTV
jgi:LDH2 family malate/lactate/ureidoglycolate dehydrogenase